MLMLLNGTHVKVMRWVGQLPLGRMIGPGREWRIEETVAAGLAWAADNNCFIRWEPAKYAAMLDRLAGLPGCRFVTVPDVWGDGPETLRRFDEWQPRLAARSLPAALVAQDGMTAEALPWDRFAALFVGGSDGWRWGAGAELVREAKRRGKWVHFGRINSQRRLRDALALDCDSVDGTGFSQFDTKNMPLAVAILAPPQPRPEPFRQLSLFDGM